MGINYSRNHLTSSKMRKESLRANTHSHQTISSSASNHTNSIMIEGRQYHKSDTSAYCMPTDEVEQDRLNSQHFSLKALLGGNMLPSLEAKLPRKVKVLDVGCGSGCWVMEMAIEHPEYEITGIDIADMFPTTIRPENVNFILGDVVKGGLPFPDNTFDFVHQRLMIPAFRSNEWVLVLAEIFRVLKPGGLIGVVESDFTEKALDPDVDLFNDEFFKAIQETDQDPYIASKLNNLLKQVNFDVLDEQQYYMSYAPPLSPIAKEMLINWKEVMISLKYMMAHRVTDNPDTYNSVVERYIEAIPRAGWKAKIWAFSAQKPF